MHWTSKSKLNSSNRNLFQILFLTNRSFKRFNTKRTRADIAYKTYNSIDNKQANVGQSLLRTAVREVYLLAGPYDGAPRPCVIHSARSGPAEGGRPTPPTSSGTGVARLVSQFTLKLQVGSGVDSKRKYALRAAYFCP